MTTVTVSITDEEETALEWQAELSGQPDWSAEQWLQTQIKGLATSALAAHNAATGTNAGPLIISAAYATAAPDVQGKVDALLGVAP
jgi:hypothetical protein